MDRTAIVLAGGASSRFGQDKGVLELNGKPLIKHVVDKVRPIVDEIIVVTSSQERVAEYARLVDSDVSFAVDVCESNSPLIGTLTGLSVAHGLYSLILPFDMPFISSEVISLLFELCIGKAAVIPRWPNGNVEPLHAVYCTTLALEAAKAAVAEGKLNMRAMIEKLRGVRYVSTLVVQQLDPELRTFFNINTRADLKKAAAMVALRKQVRPLKRIL
ncbi:MAG: molybdenum cofactor guanylyltransferase [Candidatus Bathyarchaeota archaeon]|nr:molybdenum cofactor guanylyltransferase [Candidatus Bathyarchaeota archaeon]